MTDSDNVHRDLGILRGEMSGVQENIKRVETKVDAGFQAMGGQIQSLRDDRNFARGVSYVMVGLIAALVTTLELILVNVFGKGK